MCPKCPSPQVLPQQHRRQDALAPSQEYSAGLITYAVETSLLGYLTNTSNTLAQDLTNFENAISADVSSSSLTSAEAALFQSWAQALAAGK